MLMTQSLLEDRFQLKIHRETHEAPIYELVVAKTGSKMKLSADQKPVAITPGIPQRGGPPRGMMRLNPGGNLEGNGIPVAMLARMLSEQPITGRPVIDKTGLKGLYDFHAGMDARSTPSRARVTRSAVAGRRHLRAFALYRPSRTAWTEARIREGANRVSGDR